MKNEEKKFYAHSKEGRPVAEWQPLDEHLKNVAELAADFAKPFGGEEWARLAGLWHDLGKYSNEFQRMLYEANGIESHLETKPGKVVHSEAGGHLASLQGWAGADRLVSWLIMGHHAGLADFYSDETGGKALEPKMRNPGVSQPILQQVPEEIKNQRRPQTPVPAGADAAFFIRMLFSCVIDADFLDTEVVMNHGRAEARNRPYASITELLQAFESYMEGVLATAKPTRVNQIRAEVLACCRDAAERKPAVFSLTVPTGGGKTLASLAFALRHAIAFSKRRIIYVIPYTSIIEQTAEVFRGIPGFFESVVEHHCNVVEEDDNKETSRSRLASENWDAPIIVTTAVQFFESLYACKTSRCRKLHNLANSIVIFDEAQCFPTEYLRPAVFAIRELFRFYKVTPLLCTATQPVLTRTEQFDFRFKEGFEAVEEIVPEPETLAGQLKRVEVSLMPEAGLTPVDLRQVAEAVRSEGLSLLCIVNRKEDCRVLAQQLPPEQTVHLSTNMCAAHRLQALAEIKRRRKEDGDPLLVISTSLVEAGVDLDFPVVYRALAGLDSIAQAAGRCNREGKLPGFGKTVVFVPEKQPGYVRQSAGLAIEFLQGDLSCLFSPRNYAAYFMQRFWQLGEDELDKFGILKLLSGRMDYAFRSAAEEFRLIRDDWQLPVVVPFGEAQALIDRMLIEKREGYYLRKLQRYTISINRQLHNRLVAEEHIHECRHFPGLFTLSPALYDDRFGFLPPDEIENYKMEDLIT
jgi:CRISPR-associated endonuclease/helicase Cas3